MIYIMSGLLKIIGIQNYFLVNQWVDVKRNFFFFVFYTFSVWVNLGCFACFCSCCMGCKLAKNLGETTIIGCFPCALGYLRTKLRTARRIQVSRENVLKKINSYFLFLRVHVVEIFVLQIVVWHVQQHKWQMNLNIKVYGSLRKEKRLHNLELTIRITMRIIIKKFSSLNGAFSLSSFSRSNFMYGLSM